MSNDLDRVLSYKVTWGKSDSADFGNETWTFKMVGDDWAVSAGPYALLHNDEYDDMMHVVSDAKDRIEHAESILRQVCDLSTDDKLRERALKFFDPKPL